MAITPRSVLWSSTDDLEQSDGVSTDECALSKTYRAQNRPQDAEKALTLEGLSQNAVSVTSSSHMPAQVSDDDDRLLHTLGKLTPSLHLFGRRSSPTRP